MNVGILGAIAIFAFGAAFFVIGLLRIRKNRNLRENGIRTEAVITGIIRNYLDSDHSSSYTISVAFSDMDGNEVEGELPFSPGADFIKKHPEGSCIEIIYLRNKPAVFTAVEEDFTDMLSVLFLAVGVLCALLAFFVLYQSIVNFEEI